MMAQNDRIICKLAYMPESTSGKIILAQTSIDNGKTKLNVGKVLAAGPGMTLRTGEFIPVCVKPGDVVVWEQFGAIEFEVVGKNIVCTRSEDVGVVLDETEWKGRYLFDDEEIAEYEKKIEEDQERVRREQMDAAAKQVKMISYKCWNGDCKDSLKIVEREEGKNQCETCGKTMEESRTVAFNDKWNPKHRG